MNCLLLWLLYQNQRRRVCDAVALGDVSEPRSPTETVVTYERLLIADEFTRQSGNVARTSEVLKIARTTLHDKLKKYGLI